VLSSDGCDPSMPTCRLHTILNPGKRKHRSTRITMTNRSASHRVEHVILLFCFSNAFQQLLCIVSNFRQFTWACGRKDRVSLEERVRFVCACVCDVLDALSVTKQQCIHSGSGTCVSGSATSGSLRQPTFLTLNPTPERGAHRHSTGRRDSRVPSLRFVCVFARSAAARFAPPGVGGSFLPVRA
jgi:hypothetical protein